MKLIVTLAVVATLVWGGVWWVTTHRAPAPSDVLCAQMPLDMGTTCWHKKGDS